jgi:hypothetical protein
LVFYYFEALFLVDSKNGKGEEWTLKYFKKIG